MNDRMQLDTSGDDARAATPAPAELPAIAEWPTFDELMDHLNDLIGLASHAGFTAFGARLAGVALEMQLRARRYGRKESREFDRLKVRSRFDPDDPPTP